MQPAFDRSVDVLVVGSGAGGMTAALTAAASGFNTLVIEKSPLFGGSTARSGGGIWAPNAPEFERLGQHDDPESLVRYMQAITEGEVDDRRLRTFVEQTPRMMAFLETHPSLHRAFFWIPGYADYNPELGGHPLGRALWPRPIDRRELGSDMTLLRPGSRKHQLPFGAWITSVDLRELLALRWPGLRQKQIVGVLAWRAARARVLGERIATSGQALTTRLRLALRQRNVPIWLDTPMKSLLTDNHQVVGVQAEHDGASFAIGARHGVILATGGFDHNIEMRRIHLDVDRDWSLGSADNTGDGHNAGVQAGGQLAHMDDAWWMPTMEMPDGNLFGLVAERQYPNQFIVNGAGRRFVNEAAPYHMFVNAQREGESSGISHIPAWMITDHHGRTHNFIAGHPPGLKMPKAWTDRGIVHVGATWTQLAEKIGVPAEALRETADRYNHLARYGYDEDFHRGESAYGRYYGDRSLPNPNLAEVSAPPFYAFAITPGDLGTKGGLVTDADARVLRTDGYPVPGLYAVGNVSAPVMGKGYAGAGATLASAMTFAYVAARHIGNERHGVTAGAPAENLLRS